MVDERGGEAADRAVRGGKAVLGLLTVGVERGIDVVNFLVKHMNVLFHAPDPLIEGAEPLIKVAEPFLYPTEALVHFGEAVLHHAGELFDLRFVLHAFIVPGAGRGASCRPLIKQSAGLKWR